MAETFEFTALGFFDDGSAVITILYGGREYRLRRLFELLNPESKPKGEIE